MGRKNGTWSPIYGQAWDHHKTAAAVAHILESDRRIPTDCAPSVVLGWLNRICLWCLANGETGRTGALTDGRLATIAWPEGVAGGRNVPQTGALVRRALRAGGFLEGDGPAEQVHDFFDHHARILKERRRKRDEKDAGDSAEDSAGHSAERGAERTADHSAPTGTDNDNVPTTAPTGPPSPPTTGDSHGPRAKPSPSPTETAARHLADALGSSRNPCRDQVKSLIRAGWDVPRIEAAISEHAEPGIAPWDWTKRARGIAQGARRAPTSAAEILRWGAEAEARDQAKERPA